MDALAEEARLNQAMGRIDPLLAASLQREQRCRRRRLVAAILGGIVMLTAAAMVAALAIGGGQLGADGGAPPPAPAAKQQAAEHMQAGWALWQERRMNEAAERFQAAVELDPTLANGWNGLGWARFSGGDAAASIEAFRQAVELEPGHPAALNGLGQASYALGRLDDAEQYLLQAAPKAPAAHWGLARLYLLREDFERALPWTILITQGQQAGDASAQRLLDAAVSKKLSQDLRQELTPVAEVKAEAPKP